MGNRKKNVLDFETILFRVKKILKTESDKDVANALGMKPNAFYNRKAKGSIPLTEIVCLANTHNIRIDWIINGTGPVYNDTNIEITENQIDNSHKPPTSENNNLTVIEHCDLVKEFEDQVRAKKINHNLLNIERQSKQAFRDIDHYIEGIASGLKYHRQAQSAPDESEDQEKKVSGSPKDGTNNI